jgi:cytidine deaminase
MTGMTNQQRSALIFAAQVAMSQAYAPYSNFHVGAALLFADGAIFTGSNVENASFGLSICAETVACAAAMNAGRRGGLIAVAVAGGKGALPGPVVTPCGRCRQVLSELAQLGKTDPILICTGAEEIVEMTLGALLPRAFGPATLD